MAPNDNPFTDQVGVATRRQLMAAGHSRHAIAWALESGRWQRPLPGVFVTHSGELTQTQWEWAALLWAGPGAALCGPTAAALDGLRGYESSSIYVLLPLHRRLTSPVSNGPRIVVARTGRLGPEDVHPVARPARTRIARSVIDTALLRRRVEDQFAVLAAAVQQRLVSPSLVVAAIERTGRRRGKAALRAAALDLVGGAHSLPERDFLRIVKSAGLPLPDAQSVRTHAGRRRYLDFYWSALRIAVEIDGLGHLSVSQWIEDMSRANDIVVDGDALLRFPAILIRTRQDIVTDVLHRAFRSRGWAVAA